MTQHRLTAIRLLLLGILSSNPCLVAQAADAAATGSNTSDANTNAEQTKAAPAGSSDGTSTNIAASKDKAEDSMNKTFIPSEEISEDFAVSFPVDI